jgi:predicted permease
MITFADVLITVVFLLVLALPGFIFAKLKMLPENASATLSAIVLYGCQPILIITSFQGCAFDKKIALNMLLVFLIGTAMHIIMFALVKLFFAKHVQEDKIKIVKYLSVFSNCGFMGAPFLQSLFSDAGMQAEVLIYCAVILAVFNVLNWTVGVYIITGDKREVSFKKIACNPVIISVVVGAALFFILQRPIVTLAPQGTVTAKILDKFMNSLLYLSNMVTPLSMFVIGIRLANVQYKQLFTQKGAYLATGMKLLVMPLLTMFTVAYLPIASTIKYTLFFLFSMPSATSGVMLAVQYEKDGDFASICVLLSTILCVLTIPPLYLFMSQVLGVAL